MTAKKLTDKEQLFCLEYLVDLNATQAAIRAGYSEKTAAAIGHENLRKPKIEGLIHKLKTDRAAKLQLETENVLNTLKQWANSDITDTMELSTSEIKKLPIEIRRLITGFKRITRTFGEGSNAQQEERIELTFISKERAQEMINKHIGFYEEHNKQKTPKTKIRITFGKK